MIDKNHPRYQLVTSVSDPDVVIKNANKYLGKKNYELFISNSKGYKYTIVRNDLGKKIDFGGASYYDFTKTSDEKKKNAYLARSAKIKGNWASDRWSRNWLSRNLLWDAGDKID